MNYIKKNRTMIITILIFISTLLLLVNLIFFLQSESQVKNIIQYLIACMSLLVLLLLYFPINNSIKEIFTKYRDIILLAFFLFLSEIIFFIDNHIPIFFITIFSTIFIVNIIILIALLLPKKIKFGYMLFIIIFHTIYLIAQDIYYDIFSCYLSFKEVVSLQAGTGYMHGVIDFHLIYLLYIFLALAIIIYLFFNKIDNQIKISHQRVKFLHITLVLFLVVNINAQYTTSNSQPFLSDHYLYCTRYNNAKFISRFGIINYSIRDFVNSVVPQFTNAKDIEEIDLYFAKNEKNKQINDYTGLFEGKNLIFITAESFDSIVIENEAFTPNLTRLKNESLYFTNYFVPVYPRTTSDSEFIYNTSLIPSMTDGPTCYVYYDNFYSYSLANLFKEKGYVANAFHSNVKEFYLRNKVFKGYGYDNFYGKEELNLSDGDNNYDSLFMRQAADLIINENKPFFSFVTTLSGHSPYNESNLVAKKHIAEVNALYGNNVPEEIKYYLATQKELDLLVGELFYQLEAKNALDDTVIILTSDHYPYTITREIFENYKGINKEHLKSNVPLFIWSSDIEPKTIDNLTSSFDILPTIANLFSLDANYTYYFGNDIFNDNYHSLIFFKDYSWYDGNIYVVDDMNISDSSYINDTREKLFKYYEISQKILRSNYFKLK
ncbi:MAG TPA: LTA synthase family protein [Haloplasmataceae bacterium]